MQLEWIYTCKAMSTLHSISFVEVTKIVFDNHMTMIGRDDIKHGKTRYVNGQWVCVWCKYKVWIGEPYKKVPDDLRAWFLSPQQFEEFKQLLQDKGEL